MRYGEIKNELEQCHSDCYSWALHCCNHHNDMASEVLQNAYLKILQKQNEFRGKSEFKTWAFIIIRNTSIDALRKKKRELKFISNENNFPDKGYEPGLENNFDRKLRVLFFAEALARLSERQREILQLIFYHDLSLNQTAQVLKISQGSVRKHYDRAKKSLALWFQQKGLTQKNIFNGLI